MNIAFYYAYPHKAWDWNDEDLETTGLGGAETALVFMARELAREGHQVTVFNSTSREGVYNGVRYRHRDGFDPAEPWDAFISMRGLVPADASVRARVKVYWSIEIDTTLIGDWNNVLPQVDAVFTISPFHTHILQKRYPQIAPKLRETFLGVWPGDYATTLPKVPNKLLYCSVPGMGLHHLPPIFELIRREVPEATLAITGDYSLWGRTPDNPDADWGKGPSTEDYRRLFADMPGVQFLGKVPRDALIQEQKTSVLHVYPCTVPELFCLSSMECQAAGTPTVGTALGALCTTVQDGGTGMLVHTPPGDPHFQRDFARTVIDLLHNPVRLDRLSRQARARALGEFTYERAAADWVGWFSCRL